MTNFEYWKDRILEITENDSIAVVGGKPVESKCFGEDCAKCDFVDRKGIGSCLNKLIKWLYSEHEKKPKLTKRERIFCETIMYPNDKKITRAFDDLYIGAKGTLDIAINPYMFGFIEKGKPWSVSDLLQLEVEE